MKIYLKDSVKDLKNYNTLNYKYEYKLDANESPWDMPKDLKEKLAEKIIRDINLNLYPDSNSDSLRKALGNFFDIKDNNIILGSGSDELINIIITAFVDKNDYVLVPNPSFSMYEIFTKIAGGIPLKIPLTKSFKYNLNDFIEAIEKYEPKLVFLCNPNNPTGSMIGVDDIREFAKKFNGILVIDEAYIEFSGGSMLDYIEELENVIILRTFSKAFGIAGLRIGYGIASKHLIKQINNVKPPYNLNSISQAAAILILENYDIFADRIKLIKTERDYLYEKLKSIDEIDVYRSEANFLLIRTPYSQQIWAYLLDRGFLVRNYSPENELAEYLRISVGDKQTNRELVKVLKDFFYDRSV